MNAENLGLHDFGPGDLAGLAALGRGPAEGEPPWGPDPSVTHVS